MGSDVTKHCLDDEESPVPHKQGSAKLKGLRQWPIMKMAPPPIPENDSALETLNLDPGASNMFKDKHKVIIVLRSQSNQKAILKYYHKHAGQALESFKRECVVGLQLAKVCNPHLAKIRDVRYEALRPDQQHGKYIKEVGLDPNQEYFIIVMEYCNQTDIQKYLAQSIELPEFNNLDCHEFILHCYDQILYGLQVLWQHEFVHQDIKPDNIFLDHQPEEGLRFKVGDFGSACWTNHQKEYKMDKLPQIYTRAYQPPETVADHQNMDAQVQITPKLDI